jgi:glutamate synthase domain-containing protein 2
VYILQRNEVNKIDPIKPTNIPATQHILHTNQQLQVSLILLVISGLHSTIADVVKDLKLGHEFIGKITIRYVVWNKIDSIYT